MKNPLLALACCALLSAPAAWSAEEPGQWYFSPMVSAFWADSGRHVDDDFGGQVALGRATENFNFEFSAHYYDLGGFNETEMWGAGLDIARVWFRQRRASPYFLIGGGFVNSDQAVRGDVTENYFNLAFGLLTDLTASGGVALRTELRWRSEYQDETFHDIIGNVGLQIPFGGARPEPAPVVEADSDGDGVPDGRDRCPGTPAGVRVDGVGCPLDSDGDGVADYLDKCPGTPAGTAVDERGCPLDSDGDGVLDGDDDCPGTPPGTRVDIHGCELTAVIELRGVEFELNSAQLRPQSRSVLDDMAATLKKNADIAVEVAGHTDSSGSDAYNLDLSQRRAQSVADYLISQGVDAERLVVRGYGETQPVAPNGTAEGRARNRRVELRILS